MVGIVSGNGLGVVGNALGALGGGGVIGSAASGLIGESLYLNASTGNVVVRRRDEFLGGIGGGIGVVRTYNSQAQVDGDNNDNWRLGIYRQVSTLTGAANTAGSTVLRTDGDGNESVYNYDTSRGLYVSAIGGGSDDTLAYNQSAATWTWRDGASLARETYDWNATTGMGRLLTAGDLVSDNATTAQRYFYDPVTGCLDHVSTGLGESIYFEYQGANLSNIRVVNLYGVSAIRTHYEYDSLNRLIRVDTHDAPGEYNDTAPVRHSVSYTYDGDSNRLASLHGSDGTHLSMTYVYAGGNYRLESVTDGVGRTTAYHYDLATRSTTITDPLLGQTVLHYDSDGRLTALELPTVGGASAHQEYSYFPDGRVYEVRDAAGHVTTYGYDEHGNCIEQSDSSGRTLSRRYNNQNQLLSETVSQAGDPNSGATGHRVYDSHNRLRFEISAAGRVTEYRPDIWGQVSSDIVYTGDTFALAAGAAPTEADMKAWVATQDLRQCARTDYARDFRGQTYDAIHYSRTLADGSGDPSGTVEKTHVDYDQNGRKIRVEDGAGNGKWWVYDGLDRELVSRDQIVQYDEAGGKVVISNHQHSSVVQYYDAAGRLISSSAGGNPATTYGYDALGRLRLTTGPTGAQSMALYDAAGHQVMTIDAEGGVVEYRYNQAGQLAGTTRYANRISAAQLAALMAGTPAALYGNINDPAAYRPQTDSAHDRTEWQYYDAAGRLVHRVDADGYLTEISYDGHDRVLARVRYDAALSASALAALTADSDVAITPDMLSAHCALERFIYDADGKLVGQIDAEDYLTEHRYDGGGRLVETVRYATRAGADSSHALRTPDLGAIRPAATSDDQHQYFFYDGRNRQIATLDAEGYLTEFTFDAHGNMVEKTRHAGQTSATPAIATLAELRGATGVAGEDQRTTYRYNDNGNNFHQLLSETGADGITNSYEYDVTGRLTKTTVGITATSAGHSSQTVYDTQGRVVQEKGPDNSIVQYSYDAAGNRISRTDSNGNTTLYFYDKLGLLVDTVNSLGEVSETAYDALGQVVRERAFSARLDATLVSSLHGGAVNQTMRDAIAALFDPIHDAHTEREYDRRGHLSMLTDAAGKHTRYDYDGFGNLHARHEELGDGRVRDTLMHYDLRDLLTGSVTDPAALKAASRTEYDAFGRTVRSYDANDRLTATGYDRLGRMVSVTDPLLHSTQTHYDAFSRITSSTDALGKTSTWHYDTAARRTTVTDASGASVVTTLDAYGQTWQVTDANGNLTTYEYDAAGRLTNTITAAGHAERAYDTNGNLTRSTDADGLVTEYRFDAANRMYRKTVDPNGLKLVTQFSFDGMGRAIEVTDASGVLTRHSYDGMGRLTDSVVDPAGLNLRTHIDYDASGNKLSVSIGYDSAHVETTRYHYDVLGRRDEEVRDTGSTELTTRYSYDAAGQLVARTDPAGQVWRYAYDAAGRQVLSVDPSGMTIERSYDAGGRLTRTVTHAKLMAPLPAPQDMVSSPDWAAGRIPAADPAQDRVQRTVYADDGRHVYDIDATNHVSLRSYDANGNLISETAYASTSWTLNGNTLTIAGSPQDRSTATIYNSANLPAYTIDAVGHVRANLYRAGGQLERTLDYAQPIAWPSSTPLGEVQLTALLQATPGADRNTRYYYDGAGRLAATLDAAGRATLYGYDAAGRELTRTVCAQLHSAPPFATSASDQITRNVYDAAGRLSYTVGPLGEVSRYMHDAAGNVTETMMYAARLDGSEDHPLSEASMAAYFARHGAATDRHEAAVYDGAGRVTTKVDALGRVTANTYDALGNIVETIAYANSIAWPLGGGATLAGALAVLSHDAADHHTAMAYDANGRLRLSVAPDGHVSSVQRNVFGEATVRIEHATLLANWSGLSSLDALSNAGVPVAASPLDHVNAAVYRADGKLAYQVDAGGLVSAYSYNAFGQQDSLTLYASLVPNWNSATAAALPASAQSLMAGRADVSRDRYSATVFDRAGRVNYTVDPTGAVCAYSYDGLGNVMGTLQFCAQVGGWNSAMAGAALPDNATALVPYLNPEQDRYSAQVHDAAGQLLYEVDGTGAVTAYEYDTTGHRTRTIAYANRIADWSAIPAYHAVSGTQALPPSPLGLVTADPLHDRVSATVYDAAGQPRYSIDPSGAVLVRQYDRFGNVVVQTRRANLVLNWPAAWNAGGTPPFAVPPADPQHDLVNAMVYDSANRLRYSVGPDGAIDTREYDAFGNVTRRTALANRLAGWPQDWDAAALPVAGGLVAADPVRDRVSATVYNSANQAVYTVGPQGEVTLLQYDGFGNVTASTACVTRLAGWPAGALPDSPLRSAAHPEGIVLDAALDRTSHALYDARNQLRYSISPTGLLTRHDYTAFGQETVTTTFATLLSTADPHSAAELDVLIPDGGPLGRDRCIGRVYDAAGQLSYTLDAVGYQQTMRRNAFHEVIYSEQHHVLAMGWHGRAGDLLSAHEMVSDEDSIGYNRIVNTMYDKAGRAILTVGPAREITQYRYDAYGRLTGTLARAQRLSSDWYSRDYLPDNPDYLVTSDAQDRYNAVHYNAAGQADYTVDAEGRVSATSYDRFGNTTGTRLYANRLADWGPDSTLPDAPALAPDDTLDRVTRTVRDAAGRAICAVDPEGHLLAIEYDRDGHALLTRQYADSIAWPAALDDDALLALALSKRSAADHVSAAVYDNEGRVQFKLDPAGYVTAYAYDSFGDQTCSVAHALKFPAFPASGAAPLAAALSAFYGAPEDLSKLGAADRVTRAAYDRNGRLQTQVDAMGYVETTSYTAFGEPQSHTRLARPTAWPASTVPDAAALALLADSHDRTVRTYYDNCGRPAYVIDADGYVVNNKFDLFGRATGEQRYPAPASAAQIAACTHAIDMLNIADSLGYVDGQWAVTWTHVDFGNNYNGLARTDIDANGNVTVTTFNAFGQPDSVVRADGSTTTFAYDRLGRVTARTTGAGTAAAATTRYVYSAGRVDTYSANGIALAESNSAWAVAERKALGYSDAKANNCYLLSNAERQSLLARYKSSILYDANDQVVQTIGADNAVQSYAYDAYGNQTSAVNPLGGVSWFRYDALNRQTVAIDAAGKAVETRYDAFDATTIIHYAIAVTGSTDAALPIASAWDDTVLTQHDKLGNVTDLDETVGAQSDPRHAHMVYTAFGQLQSRSTDGDLTQWRYQYDHRGNLTQETLPVLSSGLAVINTYSYDAHSNKTGSVEAAGLPEQRITSYTYDAGNRLRTVSHPAAYSYRDEAGWVSDKVVTQTFAYDLLDRQVAVIDGNNNHTQNYFDTNGDKVAQLDATGALTMWKYDAEHHICEVRVYADPVTRPDNGATPAPPAGAAARISLLRYDSAGRLTETRIKDVVLGRYDTSLPGGPAYVSYTADVVTRNAYDLAGNVLASTDANGNVTRSFYDSASRKLLSLDAAGYVVAWDYGPNNVTETRYGGDAVAYATGDSAAALRGKAYLAAFGTSAPAGASWAVPSGAPAARVRQSFIQYNGHGDTIAHSTRLAGGVLATDSYTYNGLGKVSGYTDADGQYTAYEYDAMGRRTAQIVYQSVVGDTNGSYGGTPYAAASHVDAARSETVFDGLGNVRRTIERGANRLQDRITDRQYNALGQLVWLADARGSVTSYGYDAVGNQSWIAKVLTDASGTESTFVTSIAYDGANRVLRQRDYSYAGGAKLESKKVAGQGPEQLLVSGAFWNNTAWIASTTRESVYSTTGEVVGKAEYLRTVGQAARSLAQCQETYEYNSLGQLWRTNAGDGVVKIYLYDANGNRTLELRSSGSLDLSSWTQTDIANRVATHNLDGLTFEVTVFDRRNQQAARITPGTSMADVMARIAASSGAVGDLSGGAELGVNQTGANAGSLPAPAPAATIDRVFGVGGAPVVTYHTEGTANYEEPYLNLDPTRPERFAQHIVDHKIRSITVTVGHGLEAYDNGANDQYEAELLDKDGHVIASAVSTLNTIKLEVQKLLVHGDQYTLRVSRRGSESDTEVISTQTIEAPANNYHYANEVGPYLLTKGWHDESSAEFSVGSPAAMRSKLLVGGQSADTAKVLVGYRSKGNQGPYTLIEAQPAKYNDMSLGRRDLYQIVLPDGLPTGAFEFVYMATDEHGTILNSGGGEFQRAGNDMGMVTVTNNPAAAAASADGFALFTARPVGGFGLSFRGLGQSVAQPGAASPARSATLRYRPSGSGAWQTVQLSGGPQFDWYPLPAGFANTGPLSSYEYTLTVFDGTDGGGNIIDQRAGNITGGDKVLDATCTKLQDKPGVVRISGLPAGTREVRVSYTAQGGTPQEYILHASMLDPNLFLWDTSALVADNALSYDGAYIITASGADGQPLSVTSGALRLGADGKQLSKTVSATTVRVDTVSAWNWKLSGLEQPGLSARQSQRYDAFGEIVSQTDAMGNTSDMEYDGAGRLLASTAAANAVTGEDGNTVKEDGRVVDSLGNQVYDSAGNPKYVAPPRATTRNLYSLSGLLLSSTDANGHTTSYAYLHGQDAASGRPKVYLERHADNSVRTTVYDAFGDAVEQYDEYGNKTSKLYDNGGNLSRVTRAGGGSEWYGYDELGRRTSVLHVVDGGSSAELTYYDAAGHISEVRTERGSGSTTSVKYTYTYDATLVGAHGKVTGGYVQRTISPVTMFPGSDTHRIKASRLDYFGVLVSGHDFDGNSLEYQYDQAGKLAAQTSSNGQDVRYTYYVNGKLKTATDNATGVKTERAYDANGNVIREIQSGMSYTDPHGPHAAISNITTMRYDQANQLIAVDDNKARVRYNYDAVGNVRRVTSVYDAVSGAGVQASDYWYAYDHLNRETVGRGQLLANAQGGMEVVRGETGVLSGYDQRGLRISATYGTQAAENKRGVEQSETYAYNTDGHLTDVYVYAADRPYHGDAAGHWVAHSHMALDQRNRTTDQTDETFWENQQNVNSSVDGNAYYNATFIAKTVHTDYNRDDSIGYQSTLTYTDPRTVYVPTGENGNGEDDGRGYTVFVDPIADHQENATYAYNDDGTLRRINTTNIDTPDGGGTPITSSSIQDSEYVWGDSARQSQTITTYKDKDGAPTATTQSTSYKYDANGHLTQVTNTVDVHDSDNGSSRMDVLFANDAFGNVTRRDQIGAPRKIDNHNFVSHASTAYVRAGDKSVGEISNAVNGRTDYALDRAQGMKPPKPVDTELRVSGWSDFDQNFVAINQGNMAAAGFTYIARNGDTLQSIAQNTFGDASLWYLIADANGLHGASALQAGQALHMPGNTSSVHNNTNTARTAAADPGSALGLAARDTACGPYGPILIMALAAAVSIALIAATGGIASVAVGGALTLGQTLLVGAIGGAVAGAASSAVSQGLSIAAGYQENFSWKQVAIGAVTGAVTGTIGAGLGVAVHGAADVTVGPLTSTFGNAASVIADVAGGAINNAVSQGINILAGEQKEFNMLGVAAAAGAGALQNLIGGSKVNANQATNMQAWVAGALQNAVLGTISGGASSVVEQLIENRKVDPTKLAGSLIGGAVSSVVSDAIGSGFQQARDRQAQEQLQQRFDKFSLTGTPPKDSDIAGMPTSLALTDSAKSEILNENGIQMSTDEIAYWDGMGSSGRITAAELHRQLQYGTASSDSTIGMADPGLSMMNPSTSEPGQSEEKPSDARPIRESDQEAPNSLWVDELMLRFYKEREPTPQELRDIEASYPSAKSAEWKSSETPIVAPIIAPPIKLSHADAAMAASGEGLDLKAYLKKIGGKNSDRLILTDASGTEISQDIKITSPSTETARRYIDYGNLNETAARLDPFFEDFEKSLKLQAKYAYRSWGDHMAANSAAGVFEFYCAADTVNATYLGFSENSPAYFALGRGVHMVNGKAVANGTLRADAAGIGPGLEAAGYTKNSDALFVRDKTTHTPLAIATRSLSYDAKSWNYRDFNFEVGQILVTNDKCEEVDHKCVKDPNAIGTGTLGAQHISKWNGYEHVSDTHQGSGAFVYRNWKADATLQIYNPDPMSVAIYNRKYPNGNPELKTLTGQTSQNRDVWLGFVKSPGNYGL